MMLLACGCTQQSAGSSTSISPVTMTTQSLDQGKQMVTFNEANDGSTVNVSWTSKFAVTLEENPTTGYSWNMTLSPGLELVSNNYIEKTHAAGMVGVGGTRTWIIQANDIGSQKVTAIYKRPWEATTGNEKPYSLTVNVIKL